MAWYLLQDRVASVRYKYQVAAHSYQGTRISYELYGDARRGIYGYEDGQAVTVWYNPTNPSEAVLERGPEHPDWGTVTMGAALLVAGLVIGVVAVRAV